MIMDLPKVEWKKGTEREGGRENVRDGWMIDIGSKERESNRWARED